MMAYAVWNIGNSFTQAALADAGGIRGEVYRIATSRLIEGDLSEGLERLLAVPSLAACVVPAARDALSGHAHTGDLRFLDAAMVRDVDFSDVDTTTLGSDRVANIAAAVSLGDFPVMVLDCGTCVTTEVVDTERRVRGGAILPGRTMLRRALRDYTAQLPLVPESATRPAALGKCTRDAILAGVDRGILGSVRELVDASWRELGVVCCRVVATGGDAAYFSAHLDGVTAGGPTFTLSGVAKVAAGLWVE